MSSEASCDLPKQSLEVIGMSYRCRIKWNIPFEMFQKGFNVKKESRIFHSSFLCRIKGVRDLNFTLGLIVQPTSDSLCLFSTVLYLGSNSANMALKLDYAFVVLEEETYILSSSEIEPYNPLYVSTLMEKERKGIVGKGEILPVHCLMRVSGAAISRLYKIRNNYETITIVHCTFAHQNMEIRDPGLAAYYFEGKIPSFSIESADSQLKEARELGLFELRTFISNYLSEKLTKENVIKIMRIASDNNLANLLNAALDFSEKNCKDWFY